MFSIDVLSGSSWLCWALMLQIIVTGDLYSVYLCVLFRWPWLRWLYLVSHITAAVFLPLCVYVKAAWLSCDLKPKPSCSSICFPYSFNPTPRCFYGGTLRCHPNFHKKNTPIQHSAVFLGVKLKCFVHSTVGEHLKLSGLGFTKQWLSTWTLIRCTHQVSYVNMNEKLSSQEVNPDWNNFTNPKLWKVVWVTQT